MVLVGVGVWVLMCSYARSPALGRCARFHGGQIMLLGLRRRNDDYTFQSKTTGTGQLLDSLLAKDVQETNQSGKVLLEALCLKRT